MFDPQASPVSLRVGYILKQYPRLSETFILNEILGLEQRRVDVSIFSLNHPTEGRFHPALAQVEAHVHYVASPDKASFLAALRALPGLQLDRLDEVFALLDRLAPERRSRVALQAIDVARAATQGGLDHLHAHFLTVASHVAHVVHLLTGIPYSVTAHAKDIYRSTVDWELAAVIAEAATAVVTVCDANLRHLRERFAKRRVHVVRIYNGLGLQDPAPPASVRQAGVVLGVGRLVEKKGFDLLLEAVARLAPDHADLRCVLIGDGDQREALKLLAGALGIDEIVTFVGSQPQNQVEAWLRRATLLAAPCRVGADGNQDALPTVLLEALAAGLPSVATTVAGIPEIIADGVEGLLVPAGDVAALAEAIEVLLGDPARCLEMSQAGPRKLACSFDRRQTVGELIDVFAQPALVA